jgi:fido (protein-threonine AMPylation protein)
MAEAIERIWQPIEDLPTDRESLKDTELHSLMTAWQQQAESLRRSDAYNDFLIRLRREWAIETGQIERLYNISEGATKTLIEQGFDASLLSHEDADQNAEQVIDYIKDQYQAIEGLYQYVGGDRTLGTSYVKELHCVLTAHQTHYHAKDTLGNYVLRELPRGTWKMVPNNVELGDGKVFEFCPYEHVDAEMDRLISWHREHEGQNVPPEIESAWLHHRFTLIHPFVDGNGRVARCLASLVLLKHHWFPLVVTRGDRSDYLAAIREADQGDLAPLVSLFGGLQKRAIKRAMSLGEEIERGSAALSTILNRVKEKFQHDRTAKQQLQRRVIRFGDDLWSLACDKLKKVEEQIEPIITNPGNDDYRSFTDCADFGSIRSDYFRYQIVRTANELEYFANLNDYRAWSRMVIITETQVEILFGFHGIGREFYGVLVCSGMAYTKRMTEDTKEIADLRSLSREPFYFSYSEQLSEIHDRFNKWIDEALIEGLDYWRKAIGA